MPKASRDTAGGVESGVLGSTELGQPASRGSETTTAIHPSRALVLTVLSLANLNRPVNQRARRAGRYEGRPPGSQWSGWTVVRSAPRGGGYAWNERRSASWSPRLMSVDEMIPINSPWTTSQ